MFLIQPERYREAALKLNDVNFNTLFARSVLLQHVNGQVFVDEIEHSNSFYVVHPSGMSLLYGDIKDSFLKTDLKDYMLRNNSQRRRDESLQVSPIDTEGRIDETLGSLMCTHDHNDTQYAEKYKVIKDKRVNFKFNKNTFEQYLLNTNINQYTFSKVNSFLFENISGDAVPNQFWDDASKFLSIGVGYSLIKESQPIATAFSSFRHDHMLEIGVETHPGYRRNGYGGIISAKLISYCIENNLEPIWSCRFSNQASYKLALKLGFDPTSNIPYYELLT